MVKHVAVRYGPPITILAMLGAAVAKVVQRRRERRHKPRFHRLVPLR